MRAGLIAAAVVAALAGLPQMPSADPASPEARASDRLETRRLTEVRERLERRRALQRSLQAQVDGLDAAIEALGVQHAKASAMLRSERQEARALEQRLDRLVPRFLARMAEIRERRTRAARVLADLAGKSRSVRLDPTSRARMLALSLLMLERLRHLENGRALLGGRADQTIERLAEIEGRRPALTRVRQRLRREREQDLRLRQAALDRLRGLNLEVQLLGAEQARLAQRFLREAPTLVVRAEPQADQPALPDAGGTERTPVRAAAVGKGAVQAAARLAQGADAWNRAAARVVAEASEPGAGQDSAELVAAAPAWPTAPPLRARPLMAALRSESLRTSPSASHDALGRVSALERLFLPGSLPEPSAARARGRRGTSPILPVPAAARDRGGVEPGRPELTIAAAPGQGVAAPVDGKVVFAGTFKSYGLLLILEHEREYHTLLWGLARLDVERGDQVQVGQIVGIMDARGADPPVLHVERRRNGQPIDLAASSNGIQG